MLVVVADTSPIRYLTLIGEIDVLARLYGGVWIPDAVAAELAQPRTPEVVRTWISRPPDWIRIAPSPQDTGQLRSELDPGERAAILLALDKRADLIVMDDREGVEESRRWGLAVTGTLGVLDRAAERGFLDLSATVSRLRTTNFRASELLLEQLLSKHLRRP